MGGKFDTLSFPSRERSSWLPQADIPKTNILQDSQTLSDFSPRLGVNFRYYFTYLFGDGLPSRFNDTNGEVAATKKSFGGFFITFNIGMGY